LYLLLSFVISSGKEKNEPRLIENQEPAGVGFKFRETQPRKNRKEPKQIKASQFTFLNQSIPETNHVF